MRDQVASWARGWVTQGLTHPSIVIVCLLCLWCGAACAQATKSILQPPEKESGYLAGDLIVVRAVVVTDAAAALDTLSVPVPGPVDPATELRDVAVNVVRQGNERRTMLALTYQVFLAPERVTQASLPGYTLKFQTNTRTLEAHVPEWFFHVSPLRSAARTESVFAELKPNQPVPPVPVQPAKLRFLASLATMVCAALVLASTRGWLPGPHRAPRPFARACRRIARLPPHSMDALRELHRAFDEVFGQRMFAGDIDCFLVQQSRYAFLRHDIKHFFEASAGLFFCPIRAEEEACNVLALARRLKRAERLA